MFSKATRKFVTEIDSNGYLIPVSCKDDSDNLNILSLVVKRKPIFIWQKPKYTPLAVPLSAVLKGERKIDPGVTVKDFLRFESKSENKTSGGAEAGFGPGNIHLGGQSSSTLVSSFANLKKQELNQEKLQKECKNIRLDMQHSLIQQTCRNQRKVLALVKECIVTTQQCTITEEEHEGGSFGAFLGITAPKKMSISVKNGSHSAGSNVSLQIPVHTVLAYSLIELNVKSTGEFELCQSDVSGGFEKK